MSPVTGGGQRECRRSKTCLWRSWQLAKALPANAFRLCVFACLPPRTSMRILFRPATGPVICRPTFTRTPETALRKSARRSARQASSSVPPTNWRQRPPAPTQPVALPPSETPPVKIYPIAPRGGGEPRPTEALQQETLLLVNTQKNLFRSDGGPSSTSIINVPFCTEVHDRQASLGSPFWQVP